jgi:hypothetical protein
MCKLEESRMQIQMLKMWKLKRTDSFDAFVALSCAGNIIVSACRFYRLPAPHVCRQLMPTPSKSFVLTLERTGARVACL